MWELNRRLLCPDNHYKWRHAMSLSERIKGVGAGAGGLAIVIAIFAIPTALLFGTAWVSAKVSPWLAPICLLALALCVVILLPAALFRATRGIAATGFFFASYIFGGVLFFAAFITTLELWGMIAVIIGFLFMGMGIVPVAMLAAAFNGQWQTVGVLIIVVVVKIGTRMLSLWLANMVDNHAQ